MRQNFNNRLRKVERKVNEMNEEKEEKVKVISQKNYDRLLKEGKKEDGVKYVILHKLKELSKGL